MFPRFKIPTVALGVLMLFTSAAALAPHGAAAADTEIRVTGDIAGGGTFIGVIADPVFTSFEEVLQLSGRLEGTATVGGVATNVSQEFTVAAGQTEQSNCKTIYIATGPIFVDTIGAEIQLDVFTVKKPRSGLVRGLLGGDAFCTLDDLLPGSGIEIAALADLLNDLLGN